MSSARRYRVKINEDNFIERLRARDPEAIEYIIKAYGPLIKGVLCKNLYGHKECWEECFNDVLLSVWNNSDRFRDRGGTFRNWVCAIAKYKAIDRLRREITISQKVISLDAMKDAGELEKAYCRAYGYPCDDDSADMLSDLMACLSDEDKDLFYKKYALDEDASAISRETGLNGPLIYARLSRGKKKMRSQALKQKGEVK
jgi:RNA polymerase sigma-70 factor (ECF subfamily)